ncbi:MAG: branched-chain amino acid ABC transporter permease [Burkholderiaceae bacterium]|nr:branched-chain amino acid ABC transporter permease [Burkholderiaceae bacterium]
MNQQMGNKSTLRLLFLMWLVFLIFPWVSPNGYITSLGIMFCINIMLISSLNLVMGYCGQISLCHGGFFGLGAYVSGVISAKYGFPVVFGVFSAVAIAALSSLIVALPTLRLRGHYLAMATLGFGVILSVLFVELVDITGGPNGLSGIPPITLFGLSFESNKSFFYVAWAVSLLVMWVIFNLVNSRVGRAMTSVATSEIGAASLGVNTYMMKVKVFVLSASIAALSGALYTHYNQFASPETFGFFTSVMLVMMVALGGWGSYWGPFFGAIVFTVVPELLRSFHDLELFIFGFSMIIVLMFYPGGIAAIFKKIRFPKSKKNNHSELLQKVEAKNG